MESLKKFVLDAATELIKQDGQSDANSAQDS